MNRRGLLQTILFAPVIIRTPGRLMRVRPLTIERHPEVACFIDPVADAEWLNRQIQEALCVMLGLPYIQPLVDDNPFPDLGRQAMDIG
jgi:hypothetical protein